MADGEIFAVDPDDLEVKSIRRREDSFYDETIARSANLEERKIREAKLDNSSRRIEPDMEAAGRKADVPSTEVYDTTMIEGTGPSNFWTLGMVLTFCLLMVGLFLFAGFALHVF